MVGCWMHDIVIASCLASCIHVDNRLALRVDDTGSLIDLESAVDVLDVRDRLV